jgi:hypothetical protein
MPACLQSLAPQLTSFLSSPRYLLDVPLTHWAAYEPLLSPQFVRPETAAQAELFRLLGAKPLTKVTGPIMPLAFIFWLQ